MSINDISTVDLVNTLYERLSSGIDINLVKTDKLNALSGALEMVILNRWADFVSYPMIEMD